MSLTRDARAVLLVVCFGVLVLKYLGLCGMGRGQLPIVGGSPCPGSPLVNPGSSRG